MGVSINPEYAENVNRGPCLPGATDRRTARLSPGPGNAATGAPPALVEPSASAGDLLTGGSINAEETAMSQWHDTMVDRPESDGPAYVTGWTVSGVVVLGAIVAVWVLGL